MADQKVTDLTEKTTLALTDLIYLVDVAGGNLDKKASLLSLFTGRVAYGDITRDASAATGTVAETGTGFTPTCALFLTGHDANDTYCIGFAHGTNSVHIIYNAANHYIGTGYCAGYFKGSGYNVAAVDSWDSDGFTLTWTKSGSPTGTISVYYLAFRL